MRVDLDESSSRDKVICFIAKPESVSCFTISDRTVHSERKILYGTGWRIIGGNDGSRSGRRPVGEEQTDRLRENAGYGNPGDQRIAGGSIPRQFGLAVTDPAEDLQIFGKQSVSPGGNLIRNPVVVAHAFNRTRVTQQFEVAGDLRLGQAQDIDQVPDTQRPIRKKIENSQPGVIAEALETFQGLHDRARLWFLIYIIPYIRKHILLWNEMWCMLAFFGTLCLCGSGFSWSANFHPQPPCL